MIVEIQHEPSLTETRDELLAAIDLETQCWPWGRLPYRLWSLLDMLNFREVPLIVAAIQQISRAVDHLSEGTNEKLPHLREWISGLEDDCKKIPLSKALRVQLKDLVEQASDGDNFLILRFLPVWQSFAHAFLIELGENWFLFIPKEDRDFYEQKNPIFGELVHNSFMSAQKDIAAAGRCFALDESTACVFHLMRSVEAGLLTFASHVQLDATLMSQENWKNIIDQIEKKIRDMEALPKSTEKKAKIQIFSDIASQFRYFKDAWRNQISHSLVSYDKKEAARIKDGVGDFLNLLAKNGIVEK